MLITRTAALGIAPTLAPALALVLELIMVTEKDISSSRGNKDPNRSITRSFNLQEEEADQQLRECISKIHALTSNNQNDTVLLIISTAWRI